jgi:hypothetical protein
MPYLNMLVTSIPTNIKFTGNQTLINLQVSGSVDITPRKLNVDTIITEMKFCIHRTKFHELLELINISLISNKSHQVKIQQIFKHKKMTG